MSSTVLKTTHGVLPLSGVGLSTKLLAPLWSLDHTVYDITSIRVYDETIGTLGLYQLPDATGIRVTVTPTFPTNYLGLYFVLRGRYEYKTNTTDSNLSVIYADNSAIPEEVEIVDTDIAPNVHYYYSIIALCGDEDEPFHFEFNPLTGLGSAYRYNQTGITTFLLNRLPEDWRRSHDDFLDNLMDIFGKLFESTRSDIEAYLFTANSIDDIYLNHLEDLAEYIGWGINKELDGLRQRKELRNVTPTYRQKGRHAALEYLMQIISGWEIQFEDGYRRLFTEGDTLSRSFDPTNPVILGTKSIPELHRTRQYIASSTGAASLSLVLADVRVRYPTIEIYDPSTGEYTTWLEVPTLATIEASEEVYTVTEDASYLTTITFGDGINGAIPSSGKEVYISYLYGGDLGKYTPEGLTSWKNDVGARVIFQETPTSVPLTTVYIKKLLKLIGRLKASYAIYNLLVDSTDQEFMVGVADSYEDTIIPVVFLITNTEDHTTNTENKVIAAV